MRIIDTHTHLYDEQFAEDRTAMVERAIAAGVSDFYLPNVDSKTIAGMLALETAFSAHCHPMMGLHPCSVKANFREELAIVKNWLSQRAFCAIGEIGMDLYWDKTFVAEQEEAFLTQVEWAKQYNIPFVIHSRESTDMILDLLREVRHERMRGIFHCFSGNLEQAEAAIDMGFLLGIGGVLTFKKSGLDAIVEQIDLPYLVLETDAPYLAPVPYRGKRNESAYLTKVLERLAEIKKVSLEEAASITTANAEALFVPVSSAK